MMGSLTIAKKDGWRSNLFQVKLQLLRGVKMNNKWQFCNPYFKASAALSCIHRDGWSRRKHMKKNDDIIAFVKNKMFVVFW